MEIKRVRDRGDGVKQVTVPADSDIEVGDHVKITKVEENNGTELTEEELLKRIEEANNGDADMIPLEEARQIVESRGGRQ